MKLRRNPIERLGLDNNFHMENQMKIPKTKIAKHEDFYGKEYQLFILKILKNGEGEHDFRFWGRRVQVRVSSPLDEELANKLADACNDLMIEHEGE